MTAPDMRAQHRAGNQGGMTKRPPSAPLLILASFALTASAIVGVRHTPPSRPLAARAAR